MNGDGAKIGRDAAHRMILLNRQDLEVCGVTDVISFDDQIVVLKTLCGGVDIEGSALQIHILNVEDGIVTMNGKVDSIRYYENVQEDKNSKGGFFNRLIR